MAHAVGLAGKAHVLQPLPEALVARLKAQLGDRAPSDVNVECQILLGCSTIAWNDALYGDFWNR
jgi:hypothetical protein